MQAPVIVMSTFPLISSYLSPLDTNFQRETGRKAQLSNISAAKVFGLLDLMSR